MLPAEFSLVVIQSGILVTAFILCSTTIPHEQDTMQAWVWLRYGLVFATTAILWGLLTLKLLDNRYHGRIQFSTKNHIWVLLVTMSISLVFSIKFIPWRVSKKDRILGAVTPTRYSRLWTIIYVLVISVVTACITLPSRQILHALDSLPLDILKTIVWSLCICDVVVSVLYWYFMKTSLEKSRLGSTTKTLIDLPKPPSFPLDHTSTSASFDSRTKWPKSISPVRDQGHCAASCVFFAATSCLSDRWCIAKAIPWVLLSPQYVMNCTMSCSSKSARRTQQSYANYLKPCGQSDVSLIMSNFLCEGSCSGGTTTEFCNPYRYGADALSYDSIRATRVGQFIFCASSILSVITLILRCVLDDFLEASVQLTCATVVFLALQTIAAVILILVNVWKRPTVDYTKGGQVVQRDLLPCDKTSCQIVDSSSQKYFFDQAYRVTNSKDSPENKIKAIQTELVNRGPVVATFKVYADFGSSPSAYESDLKNPQGGLAVNIMGWKADYWLIRNSWGPHFGMRSDPGYYYHKMSTCGIEDNVVAGFVTPIESAQSVQQIQNLIQVTRKQNS